MKYDAIIIGAGAAGLFCAAEAGKRGRKVLLVEHNAQVGRKILISGGGRCNFTNKSVKPENFISNNPHFCKSALAQFTAQDFVELVKKHKIEYYEKTLGQLFCRDSARQIVEMLVRECEAAKVKILTNCAVKNVNKEHLFEIETNHENFTGESLVIATGGLSFPKIGATGFGYKIAEQFGLKLIKTRPSLVPLMFDKEISESYGKLSGISINAEVSTAKNSFRENILFTHRGLSGPAILQISNYWKNSEMVEIDLLPEINIAEILEENSFSRQRLDNFLGKFLPNRFTEIFIKENKENFSAKNLNQLNKNEIKKIAGLIHSWQVKFNETEGYHKAEVTLGGVSTDELSSQTMEAKKVAGLYFIGEITDVTGWLGGYNFQWAWSSGFAAGKCI